MLKSGRAREVPARDTAARSHLERPSSVASEVPAGCGHSSKSFQWTGHSMHKCVPVNVTVTVSFMLNMSVSFICRTVYFCGDTTIKSIKNLSSLAIQQQFVAIEKIQFNKVRFHSIYIWCWLWLHTCARDQFIVAWPIRRLCSLTVTFIIIRSKMSDYCRLDFCFFFLICDLGATYILLVISR